MCLRTTRMSWMPASSATGPNIVSGAAFLHDKRLSALAHPIRLHILSVAESEDISASEVAVALTEPLGVVAYHFRVLHTAGLIELVGTQGDAAALSRASIALRRPAGPI